MRNRVNIETAVYVGTRDSQQDAVTRLLSSDRQSAIAILADGIGGHGHGNIASKLAVDTCADLLRSRIDALASNPSDTPSALKKAAEAANDRIAKAIEEHPDVDGMGSTLVIAALMRRRLYWCSIGDSMLSHYKPKTLKRLNANHSLSSGLDDMVKIGAIDETTARQSGKGSVLTSALTGKEIKEINCPIKPLKLGPSDVVLVCSDGIETLTEIQIEGHCRDSGPKGPAQLCASLIEAVVKAGNTDQDNLSIVAMVNAA